MNEEEQVDNIKKSRFDRLVVRLSSWMILLQSISSIVTFIIMLYFGFGYQGQCPIQPMILTYFIGHGCSHLFNAIALLAGFITARYIKRSSTPSPWARRILIGSLIGQLIFVLFSIAWLVAGQVWVFGAQRNGFQSNDSTQSNTYCRSIVFWNAFVNIILTYVMFLISILVFIAPPLIKRCKRNDRNVDKNFWCEKK